MPYSSTITETSIKNWNITFTGNDPRKGWRITLKTIKYNEQRDEETGYGYLPHQARQAHHGARYMDHELMTMWLSVDPMADKYPSISPYAYCTWNPVKLIVPDGREIDESGFFDKNGKVKCQLAYDAFRFFAKTTFGYRALALFAKEGQTIAGQKFTKNGLFHKAGIDLAFNLKKLPYAGNTNTEFVGSEKSERIFVAETMIGIINMNSKI